MPRPANPDAPKRATQGPRPAYVMLKGERAKEFAALIESGDIQIVEASRKADDVLNKVYAGDIDAFLRFMVK